MKSDTFNFKRFGEYFALDLKTCFKKVGLSTLVCGLIPVIMLVLVSIFNFISTDVQIWKIGNEIKDMVTALSSVLFFLIAPISCYGALTDRKDGGAAVMLPVSHTEKYVSMLLISMVILPLTFCTLYLTSDAVLCRLFPGRYEGAEAALIASNLGITMQFDGCAVNVTSLMSTFFMPWMVSAAGLAGAVLFKKGKGAKTFITCALSFILLVAIIGSTNPGTTLLSMDMNTVDLIWILFQTFCAICCLTYLYFRTKKIEL